MIREIIIYPNPILKKISHNIVDFDEILFKLLEDMFDTMRSRDGIGLAAIQIAEPWSVFIINLVDKNGEQRDENLIEYINPKILSFSGSTTYQEGCLSVPGFYEDIKRFETIKVEYFNREGERIVEKLDGLASIAFQHELDHLNGKLFIEKLSFLKRKKFEKDWKKQIRKRRL